MQSIEDFGECGKNVYIYTNLDHLQRTIMCVERERYTAYDTIEGPGRKSKTRRMLLVVY